MRSVGSATVSELEAIQADEMADDIPINLARMRYWTEQQARAYFANNGVLPAPSSPAATQLDAAPEPSRLSLPYLVGVTPSPAESRVDPWRPLRAAAQRAQLADGAHGFSALGLPPGSCLTVLTSRRYAVRAALGSAATAKFTLRKLGEHEQRRKARAWRRKVDTEREAALRGIARESPQPQAARATGGPARDASGVLRGQCPRCNACAGFVRPKGLSLHSQWVHCCAGCGCFGSHHEERQPTQMTPFRGPSRA